MAGVVLLSSFCRGNKMIHIFTNRRLVNSTTANVLDAKLRIEHYDIKSEDIVIGVFGETEVQDGSYGAYQNFDLLYVSDQQTSDIEGSRLIITEDKRGFDDHMNIETSWFPSAPTVRMGESIGSQANHGFYLFFRPEEGNQVDNNLSRLPKRLYRIFQWSHNETRSIGNLLNACQDFSIKQNEHICSISFYQRHQTIVRTQLPGDVLSVEGLRFALCRWVDGKAHVRHSPYLGPSKTFGPFLNEQRGLWNASSGGNAGWAGCFPRKRTRIMVQSGSSFAGMYLESSSTHVRRAGVLVSDQYGLPENVEQLFSRKLRKRPNLAAKEPPSDQTAGSVPRHQSLLSPSQRAVAQKARIASGVPGEPMVIGLEFVSRDGDNTSALLGHRSVWMEHAIETEVGEWCEVERFEVEGQHEAGRGFGGVKIIIAQANLDNSADGSKRTRKTVGFYAYVGGRGKESHIQLSGETALVSWYTWPALWGRTMDTKINFEQVSVEFYGEGPSKTFPQGFGTKIGEMFEFMGAYGCDGGDPACKRKEELDIEMPGLRSAEENINSEDWSLSSLTARSFSTTLSRKQINKILPSASAAIENMKGNTTLLAGGFGLCGVPDTLINTVHANPHIKGLTAVSNNAGIVGSGLGLLLESKQIAKMIASYVGENKLFEQQYLKGEIEMELTPQGTLAERCRAGGAGIPAFYTPAAFGTVVQTGELPLRHNADGSVQSYSQPRDVKVFNGKSYVMEEAIRGDYAFVKAWKADRLGNCMFRYAASNFNGAMGRNAKETIVEAEHIVEPGDIDPAAVHLPGIYVKKVIQSTTEKKIEKYNFSPDEGAGADMGALGKGETAGKRERIVRRAAKEFKSGMYANLGIGMPMLAPSFVDPSVSVTLQSENGILGLGPYPKKGQEDPDLINAGKETVTLLPGASCFGSDESFGMIRSGRIDLTILGAMQVSGKGDLANWMLPGKIKGFGGAMDLVSNPQETKVVVTMEHVDKKGRPKILKQCEFPLTGKACVSRIITDLCVFDVDFTAGLTLIELAEGVTVDEIRSKTEAEFQVADNLGSML
ncbi:MAG: hypothetical protein ASARMPRED_009172 [Alectoria sarmentosa]|nr:MAG: hypothetical protein ASARMPRED_009172 [Alectoria sarmentosa]